MEKETATHSSNLAWEIEWIEEPSGLLSNQTTTITTVFFIRDFFFNFFGHTVQFAGSWFHNQGSNPNPNNWPAREFPRRDFKSIKTIKKKKTKLKLYLNISCTWNQLGILWGFPGGSDGKAYNARRPGFNPQVGKIPWRRIWQLTPVFLPRESPWTEEPGRL